MKYCPNCGERVSENQDVCLNCGKYLSNDSFRSTDSVNDTGSIGWAFIGFFIPIVGIILYILWNNTQPKNAKAAGKGALISIVLSVILSIIIFVLALSSISRGFVL